MDKKILKQLKTDYEDLEIKPSESLWDQIELGLDNDSETIQKSMFQWWKYAAVIVLLISFGALFYFNSNQFSKSKQAIAVKKTIDNNSKPTEDIESVAKNKNEESSITSEIIKSEKTQKKQSEILVETQNEAIKETPKIVNTEFQIGVKPEIEINNKPEQLINESTQLATTKPVVKEMKVKYITANDLIFQRKYNVEQKKNAPENTKRLGIIKINRISVSPEFITIFNSSNNTDEKQ
ncbi:hypothetical protein [Chryseobacterium indoltheticum]|jgi:hypothetical protein|uniref:hypothetical protein n=1 Tax=Chryseobacterium indoltheticum TaxID=254 RepID=UPI00243263BE|nr:hypothetical protein [Chryseobacterium indoltheticum]MDF2832712.1 hypothetical protein [Chryseobacterium indoltheticum]